MCTQSRRVKYIIVIVTVTVMVIVIVIAIAIVFVIGVVIAIDIVIVIVAPTPPQPQGGGSPPGGGQPLLLGGGPPTDLTHIYIYICIFFFYIYTMRTCVLHIRRICAKFSPCCDVRSHVGSDCTWQLIQPNNVTSTMSGMVSLPMRHIAVRLRLQPERFTQWMQAYVGHPFPQSIPTRCLILNMITMLGDHVGLQIFLNAGISEQIKNQ